MMVCGDKFRILRDVTIAGTLTSTTWNHWMTFYTGIFGRKYHVLPLASLLVKLLTNNGIFSPEASALTVHFSHFYNRLLFRIIEKRVDVFLNTRRTWIWVTFLSFFSWLAYPPAEDRQDGPSKPLSSGECWAHTTKTRCVGTASLPCDNKTRPALNLTHG